jgi:hypothetical protein
MSATAVASPTTLSAGPNGMRKASAPGLNLRNRIREAHTAAYKTIIPPEVTGTSQRKVPLDASTHPTNAKIMVATGLFFTF